MRVRATWAVALVLFAVASCASEAEDETQVAVKNSGTASISVALSDGDAELRFDSVAASTTSTFQIATFGSLSGLMVSAGGATSTIGLTGGKHNVVDIGGDGQVLSVFVAAPSPGSEGGGAW